MRLWWLVAVLPVLIAASNPSAEPPERIRQQKEWLTALGYFNGALTAADTRGYRTARDEFRDDIEGSTAPDRLHQQLKMAFERNKHARGTCRGRRSVATACVQKPNQ